jgi:hypothetical protein
MSSTEPQTGVRFRVGSSRGEKGDTGDDPTAGADASGEAGAVTDQAEEAVTASGAEPAAAEAASTTDPAPAAEPATGGGGKQTRLMADLTRAMQTAALTARSATMEQFNTDAKAQTEAVHKKAADESAELRQKAEDDIAAIRDWSKAEQARLREETEERISGRRTSLDHELEAHTGRVERRLERLQDRVKAYESRMDRFFETLMAEENAARLASMAEQMPEPPSFDDDDDYADDYADEPVVEVPVMIADETPEAATVTEAEPAANAPSLVVDIGATGDTDGLSAWGDPRLAALGAAETAPEDAPADGSVGGEVPEMDDETLAARLAGILPTEEASAGEAGEAVTTQVKVLGLVSVAAIAGFKRSLGRVEGVNSVGVSSGPDGHFLFAVAHGPNVVLRDAVPTFAGFEARVTGSAEGTLEVTARDPEAGS